MAQGKVKLIIQNAPKFGAEPEYLFLKVEWADSGEGGEEYWLLTLTERRRLERRAARVTGSHQGSAPRPLIKPGQAWLHVLPDNRRGVVHRVWSEGAGFGSDESYLAVFVRIQAEEIETWWVLTDKELERIRRRVFVNHEDIDREREGWLADLFD